MKGLAALLDLTATDAAVDAALAPLLDAYPVQGTCAPLLALRHDLHGRPEILDRLFDRLVQAKDWDAELGGMVLAMALDRPDQARLATASHLLAISHPCRLRLWSLLLDGEPRRIAARRELLAAALADTRGIDSNHVRILATGRIALGGRELRVNWPGMPATLPAGFRWCDLAALSVSTDPASWGRKATVPFPWSAALAERDAACHALAQDPERL